MQDNTSVVPPAQKSQEDGQLTGILDIVGNRAFLRAEGYLPGPRDAPVPLGLVREHGLRAPLTNSLSGRGYNPFRSFFVRTSFGTPPGRHS